MKGYREPVVCGGTDRRVDENAPRTIQSEQMTAFFAESEVAMHGATTPPEMISYVCACAVPAGEGTFCQLTVRRGYPDEQTISLAWIREDLFPKLVLLTKELNFSAKNGCHSTTHGLPENFGGSVRIEYQSGEKISFGDNQGPIFSMEAAEKIENLFSEAMRGEEMPVPPAESIQAVRFAEERANGGFSHACMFETPEGKVLLKRESKYGDSKVYTSEQEVPRERMERCRDIVRRNILFAFAVLPQDPIKTQFGVKTLNLSLADGSEVTVRSDRLIPPALSGVFFEIELDLVSK